MERLQKVHAVLQESGFNDRTMLDELVLWLSNDEINEFLEDFRSGWDLDIDVNGKEVPPPFIP